MTTKWSRSNEKFRATSGSLYKKRNSVKYFPTSVGSMCKVAFWVGGVMIQA